MSKNICVCTTGFFSVNSARLLLALLLISATAGLSAAAPAPGGISVSPRAGKMLRATANNSATTAPMLVLLVEFAGSDTAQWTYGASTWDPIGRCDPQESTGVPGGTSNLVQINHLETTHPLSFTYNGPLHNTIARPLSAGDPSGTIVWTPDFSPSYYRELIFGGGVKYQYSRQDGSAVNESLMGRSLNQYLADMSGGKYGIEGEVLGWIPLPHSVWWYGADEAPGARSGIQTLNAGCLPGGGSPTSLVRDALDWVKSNQPAFDWPRYDRDKDGVIDHLVIVFAGLSENDSATLLNRTSYGEGTLVPMSSALPTPYQVFTSSTTIISASPYTLLPENFGNALLTNDYLAKIGASDLQCYGMGVPSAGSWSPMSTTQTGYPYGSIPAALDPLSLERLGWVYPLEMSDPTRIYLMKIGQVSASLGDPTVKRGLKIKLEDGREPLPIAPLGAHYWWGGEENLSNAMMTLKHPIDIPASGDTSLTLSMAYSIETSWDFLWIQASSDNGVSWETLTNNDTVSTHDSGWIGQSNGFPDDLAAAGIGGFTGNNPNYPDYNKESFSLAKYKGRQILIRFWYMTDWGTIAAGPFIDNIQVMNGATPVFADNGEYGIDNWTYSAPWVASDGNRIFTHNYYLQWRNVAAGGGFDSALGDPRSRFGAANGGLLVWYNNNRYANNEVSSALDAYPGFGPKGKMLLVDAHPEPYRDPYWVSHGYPNEGANLSSWLQMRDAAFSRKPCIDFKLPSEWLATTSTNTLFPGYPAVSRFSDGEGYYPGAEFVSRGPGYTSATVATKWVTRQWDASVVIPSKKFYGVKAPGYLKTDPFRYSSERYPGGLLLCYWFASGLGYDGGSGRPRDVGGQFGWNILISNQTDSSATLIVWNELGITSVTAVPDQYALTTAAAQVSATAAGGVLANDSGPVNWKVAARAELVSSTSHGTLNLRPDGSFTYQMTDKTQASDSFTYRIVTDFDRTSSPTLVTLRHASGSLAVRLTPPEAVAAGAGWRRASTPLWRNGGTTETEILTGEYPLEFKPLVGWTSPAAQSVTVNGGQTTTATGTYVRQTGGLRVTLTPSTGKWRRVGTQAWLASGYLEQGIPTGAYEVEFQDLTNWRTPARRSAMISAAQTAALSVAYIGYVSIAPAAPLVVAKPGQSAQLQALVSGTPAIALQWKKNGVAIGGATSAIYSIAACQAANQGLYTCVGRNAYATTESTAIRLVVDGHAPVLGYLLGTHNNSAGLNLNGDGRIDVSDLVMEVRQTPPAAPASPQPVNSATGVALKPVLNWADCFRAVSYDLYLWKASASKPAKPTAAGLGVSQWALPASLDAQTSYRWQVIARGAAAQTTGPVWAFKTK